MSAFGTHDGSTYDEMLRPPIPPEGTHMLVVIDHREARIYQITLRDSVPERITPYDSRDDGRCRAPVREQRSGQNRSGRTGFYREIAQALQGAGGILVFAHGKDARNVMRLLMATLRRSYKDLALRIIGSVVIDGTHPSERQLLARARAFYDADLGRIPR